MEHPFPDLPDVGPICPASSHSVLSSQGTNACHHAALDTLLAGLRQLRTDHTSGAKELATHAVASLVRVAGTASSAINEEESATPPDGEQGSACGRWWEATRRAAWAISRHGRPSMGAAITAAVVGAMDHARAGLSEDPQKLSDARSRFTKDTDGGRVQTAIRQMQDYLQQRSRGAQSTAIGTKLREFVLQNFQHRVDEEGKLAVKILTLSSSSTVRQALMILLGTDDGHCPRVTVELRIMESRPLCEGVDLAKALVKYASNNGLVDKLHIETASDSSVAMLARDVDLVLLGADRISAAGDVSNKTGSLPAVLCAKAQAVSNHVSVVTISELEKIAKPGGIEEHGEEDNDVEEVVSAWRGKLEDLGGDGLDAWNKMVAVRNVYFEWVPATHVDCYICEDGLLSADDIRERSEQVRQAETRLFGDLDESAAAATAHSSGG